MPNKLKIPSIETKEFRELLDLIPAIICVLDEMGQIIFTNTNWEVFARIHGIPEPSKVGVGSNYLEFCSNVKEVSEEHMKGINALLNNEIPNFESEYFCDAEEGRLWFIMKAVAQKGRSGCWAFHFDITEKKIAEEKLKKSHQQLRDLSNKLQTTREEDKKRISREIHDELGQTLAAIKLDLTWLEKRIDVSEPPVRDKIKSIYSHLENSLETVRRVSTELRPQVLDVMGFCEALQWQAEKFVENTNIQYKLNIEPEGIKLHPELSTDLFRIFQEALTNISRHSQATQVMISFVENKTGYELCVKDDGVGISNSRVYHSNSLGLLGIRERVLIWKGRVEIKGIVGEGTWLTVKIPKANT